MDTIEIVDTTLRDGQQSLWACRMRAAAMVPALVDIDTAGYAGIEFSVPTAQFPRAVRDLGENPWDWLVEGSAAAPRSDLRLHGSMESKLSTVPRSVQQHFLRRLAQLGIQTTRTSDPWNDFARLAYSVDAMAEHGIRTVVNLIYSVSPRHTFEYYERKMLELMAMSPYRVCLKDVGGLMTPEVAQALIPMVVRLAGETPVEFHAHCNSGLAPYVSLLAAELGITTIHTAIPPLANGSSQPSVFSIVENLRARGFQVDLDLEPLRRASDHLGAVALGESLIVGEPMEYDEHLYHHQVPGGMISNLRFQLGQLGQLSKLAAVLVEVAAVRRDFGYPIMVTPLSQFVGTQAVINVLTGDRYKVVTDETILFALGRFGEEAIGLMDPAIRDGILNTPHAKQIAQSLENSPEDERSLDELRRDLPQELSDDDLVVHYFLGSSASSTQIPPRRNVPRSYDEYAMNRNSAIDLLRAVKQAGNIRTASFQTT